MSKTLSKVTPNVLIIGFSLLLACGNLKDIRPSSTPEATFWKLCYQPDGDPWYPNPVYPYDNVHCSDPEEIEWTLPIRVAVEQEYSDSQLTVLKKAIFVWNGWAGGLLFQLVPLEDPHDVTVGYGSFALGDALGIAAQAPHVKSPLGVITFNIYVYQGGVNRVSTVAHELGHVLGLQHDDSPRSIMFSGAEYVPWLTRADAFALRAKYELPFSVCLL